MRAKTLCPKMNVAIEYSSKTCFRRGIASNLFALGAADDKVVQRILRRSKPHVTRERYIKAFEPAVLAAMDSLQHALDELELRPARVQQLQ